MNYITQFMVDNDIKYEQRFRVEESNGHRFAMAFYFDRQATLFAETIFGEDIESPRQREQLLLGESRIWDIHECSDENYKKNLDLIANLEIKCGIKAPNIFGQTAKRIENHPDRIVIGSGYRNKDGNIKWYDNYYLVEDDTHTSSVFPDHVSKRGALAYLVSRTCSKPTK